MVRQGNYQLWRHAHAPRIGVLGLGQVNLLPGEVDLGERVTDSPSPTRTPV